MDKRLAGRKIVRGYYLRQPVIVHLPDEATLAERKKLRCCACGSIKKCSCDPKNFNK